MGGSQTNCHEQTEYQNKIECQYSTTFELKNLAIQGQQLRASLKRMETRGQQAGNDFVIAQNQLYSIENKLRDRAHTVLISEHAIIQYITRYTNIDIEAIKSEIIDERTAMQIEVLGDGRYPVKTSKHALVVRDKVIVTVL